MPFPNYKQPDTMDCGPTCLRMVAKRYRRDIALQYLRDKTQIGKEGVNLLVISDAAETIDIGCYLLNMGYYLHHTLDGVKHETLLK